MVNRNGETQTRREEWKAPTQEEDCEQPDQADIDVTEFLRARGVDKECLRVRECLREGASLYVSENKDSVLSWWTLREAFKIVLRGQAQAVLGVVKKEMRLACTTIEKDIVSLEARVLSSSDPEDREQLRLR
ncbi:hypothetical protein NDU88_000728 [Pleurodeles waltl]|uniref:Uncharacterized protein n=1 Tax=Pleurodeles waltl TaxID=8319 RepID=A0AAV7R857_PLEWA|nr:hypothetical protein NDU88_000728 [Pleurodeles waltl]